MRIYLLGVRGSTPAPGLPFVRYGGHTSCVALATDGSLVPSLLLDAGTGLRNLGGLLGPAPFRGTILLTHLHWDHLHGLPFTPCVDRPDAEVDMRLPAQGWRTAKALLGRAMSPPSFPIGVDGLRGRWRTSRLRPGSFEAEGFTVTAAEIPHKGGRTFGYRVSADGASIAYLPDHVLAGGPTPAARMLAEGVDVLLHDASNAPGDRAAATCFGHSTVDDAVAFARTAGVRQLVLTHHAPSRTDDELDMIVSGLEVSGLDVVVAWEGAVLHPGRLARTYEFSSRASHSNHMPDGQR